jgi:AAA domain
VAEIIRPFPQRVARRDLGERWETFYPSQILEHPGAPDWLIDGLIMRRTVVLMAGAKAVGKTLLGQQLLSSVALGLPFVGNIVEQVNTFFYACEDAQEWLERRQFDINRHLQVEMPDYEHRFGWQSRAGKGCVLASYEYGKMTLTGEWRHLWDEVKEIGAQLVLLDPAAAIFGGNPDKLSQVQPFVRACVEQAIAINGAVIININTAKSDPLGFGGAGAWHNAVRAGFNMHRPPDAEEETNDRVLRDLGSNYTARKARHLRWADGVFVADDPTPPPPRTDSVGRRDVMDRELLLGLYSLRKNGALIPADVMMPRSLPRCYRATFDKRTSLNDLYASQERLIASRQVVRVRVGGRCLLRPADGAKYPDEEAWAI